MNQKIKEFSEQARSKVPSGLTPEDWIAKYNEIFAQMIVDECASLFLLTFTDEPYQRRVDKTIRKHFGVE